MRKLFTVIFVFLLAIACSDRKKIPKGILPQPKMQEVLWDMISAGEFLNGYVLMKDSVDRLAESSKKYGQVLQFHHITKEEFEKSYSYYRQHPELMKVILDSLSKKQIIPEEIYKPETDTLKKADTIKRDTLRKRLPKKIAVQ
ncbi:MAG TPA: DUF4296 domain-containing protein [Chitinophagaceae bacterium]